MFAAIVAATAILLAFLVLWLIGERGHYILPSTRREFERRGWGSILRLHTWHFYVYGRWPRYYIGLFIRVLFRLLVRLGKRPSQWLTDHYHGKVLTPEHAQAIIKVNREIPLQDLEQVIPYPAARDLLLEPPLDIAVFECPCRLARATHCEPTQVCMIMGQPFVDLIMEHHPGSARRIGRQAALDVLADQHRRGNVHVAWFKGACLNRFFAICNCCSCCCGGIEAMMRYGIPMIAASGFSARVSPDSCTGCGSCGRSCVFEAIVVDEHARVDRDKCMGCGLCVDRCPQDAISLVRDSRKGIPLDVHALQTGSPNRDTAPQRRYLGAAEPRLQ